MGKVKIYKEKKLVKLNTHINISLVSVRAFNVESIWNSVRNNYELRRKRVLPNFDKSRKEEVCQSPIEWRSKTWSILDC